MVALEIPSEYGWVVLSGVVVPFILGMNLGGSVMSARDKLDVPYPNLYAVPGVHKHAEEFNRVQRGHQSYLESLPQYMAMTLAGGLIHPYACAIGGVFHAIGSKLYAKGYSDITLDVTMARHKKGGPIKYIGIFTSLFCSIKLAYVLIKSSS